MNPWLQSMLVHKGEAVGVTDVTPALPSMWDKTSHLVKQENETDEAHLDRIRKWQEQQGVKTVKKTVGPRAKQPRSVIDLSDQFDYADQPPEEIEQTWPPDGPEPPELVFTDRGLTKIVTGFDVPGTPEFVECEDRELHAEYDLSPLGGYYTESGELVGNGSGVIPGVDPIITRMGGKNQLLEYLLPLFPRCHTYVEPFGGTFQVLLRKPWVDKVEIINEIDQDIVHLYQYVRAQPNRLVDYVNSLPTSEALILGFRTSLDKGELHGVQRAAATLCSIRTSFNGLVSASRYKSSPFTGLNIRLNRTHVEKIKQRLDLVDIRSRDFRSVIVLANKNLPVEVYPPGHVFFYLDPPYWQKTGYESHKKKLGFGWKEHLDLADLCYAIHKRGNFFIQTNSGVEDIRQLYFRYKNPDGTCCFYIEEVDVKYTIAGDTTKREETKEFIISNWPLRHGRGQGKLF